MRNMYKLAKLFLLISVYSLLLIAVTDADEEKGIYGIDVNSVEDVNIIPQMSDGTAVEKTDILIDDNLEEYYKDAERMELRFSGAVTDGALYLVLVIKGEAAVPSADNIVYIDQTEAAGSEIVYNIYPSALEDGPVYYIYLASDADEEAGLNRIAQFRFSFPAMKQTFFLPSSMQIIEASAFENDQSISGYVVMPEGLEAVYENAFAGTNITSVYFPDSMTFIDDTAFGGASVTVYCGEGSYAETWADENGLDVVIIS